MKRIALALVVLVMFPLFALTAVYGSDEDTYEFKGRVVDELDKMDVDQLMDKVKALLEKYESAEDDFTILTDATMSFVDNVNDYAKKVKAAPPDSKITAPHDELKDYCSKLEAFLKKYNVTVEDTLEVGRVLTYVAMSVKETKEAKDRNSQDPAGAEEIKKASVSKDDINDVILRLKEFSKKHNIMACDLMPVIYSLCDIGLTLMQNKVTIDQVKSSGGRWRKRLYDLGVSKEQADALYDNLVAFTRKYNIGLLEIVKLNGDINKLLKANKKEE